MAEFLRPSADVSIGDWTTDDDSTSNLYAELDESSADSADYIKSGPGPDPDAYKAELTNPSGTLTDATFRIRFRKDGTDTVSLTARLLQDNYPTTWNEDDKTANIALSGNDLVATTTSSGDAAAGIRSIASASSGRKYAEVTITNVVTNPSNWVVGIANASWVFTDQLGVNTNSVGYAVAGSVVVLNSSTIFNGVETWAEGDIFRVFVDLDTEELWIAKNGGNWNESGTANPDTNTEGIDISGLATGPYFFAFYTFGQDDEISTTNFGASSYAYTPPSGSTNWASEAEIASWEYEDIADTDTDEEETLTAPQIAAITDPDALRIELEANWSALLALYDLVGGLWYPAPQVAGAPIVQSNTFIIDADGEMAAMVFRAPKTGSIDRFDFNINVANSPDNGLRASLQSVDGATGLPSGTILGATNNAFVTYAHTVTAGWKSTNFTESASVTRGDLLAAVVGWAGAFTASDNVTVWRVGMNASRTLLFPYGVTGSATKETTYLPNMAIHYTDGYVPIAPLAPLGANNTTTVTYNSSTASADEWGMAFSVPGACKLNAVQLNMTTAAGGNFDIVLYDSDGTTELAVTSFDADATATGTEGQVVAFLQSTVTLTPNVTYRVTLRPTTTTNVVLRYWTFASLALMDTMEGGSSLYMTSQVDDGGTWTDYNSGTFRRPAMSLQLSAISGA